MKRHNQRRRLTKAERHRILKKTNGHCAYCGCELMYEDMQIDHVVPISCGGADADNNMLPACRSCNHYKGGSQIDTFRRYVEKMPSTLDRDSVTYRNAVRFGLVVPRPHKVTFYFEREGRHNETDNI
ncbi:HNH endonuclease [Clostridia bacterium]|nr:HNH endonuclease [Clostridia bacterium]